MALPVAPTVANLVTEAFALTGHRNPPATLTDRATTTWMREIAADFHAFGAAYRELETEQVTVTTEGNARYDVPSDFSELLDITLLDGSDDDRATARGGSSSTITLAANDAASDTANRISKEVLLTGGTGSGQLRTITAFNTTTKVATVDQNWTTVPDATTTYLLVSRYVPLEDDPLTLGLGRALQQTRRGRPAVAAMLDRQYHVLPVPDKSTYGLRMRYYLDLTKIDLAGTRYLRLIQQWENVWLAGLVTHVHENYDDERAAASRQDYINRLQALGAQQAIVDRVEFRSV